MAKRKGSSAPSCSRARKKAENAQRLDKLPPEVWEKILDELANDDLFPLALSCRYFRQKQKELVARTRQSGPESGKPRRALKTTFTQWWWKRSEDNFHPLQDQPASAEYLVFCSKEKVSKDDGQKKAKRIRRLAALHGHLPLLQELLEPANELDPEITEAAARGGQLETLQWLKTQKGFNLKTGVCTDACRGGHLEVLKWLRSVGCPWNESACKAAAGGGHLETLKWLRSEGCPWDEGACSCAANGAHLEALKWLRSAGCPWSQFACSIAVRCGHVEVLRWLRSEGCPWFEETSCDEAAENGHLDVLKYLHESGCPWNKETCRLAAHWGHLDVLKYLHENGCPWDAETWWWARGSTRKWLEENGCPQDFDRRKWLEENGIPEPDDYSDEYSDDYSDEEFDN